MPILETVLPNDKSDFRPRRYPLDQVALLTEDMEVAFDLNVSINYNKVINLKKDIAQWRL
jgi:hypothetical protein